MRERERIYLVVTGAEDEFGIGIAVQDSLDDFSFVNCDRTHFEVFLPDENCVRS